MINLLIFSGIAGIVFSLLVVPFVMNNDEAGVKFTFNRGAATITSALLFAVILFTFYYFTNMDRNWTSLWVGLIIVTLLGVLSAGAKERKFKVVLFLGSLGFGLYMLTAPLFNADKKYEVVEMEQKTEITAFDETKTPASVPPQFARNKMKKAFSQVPNTSYYELGNLQTQKVNG
jgi:peptidoglycan/LPS O-acetylase OafA/YrhL